MSHQVTSLTHDVCSSSYIGEKQSGELFTSDLPPGEEPPAEDDHDDETQFTDALGSLVIGGPVEDQLKETQSNLQDNQQRCITGITGPCIQCL